MRSVLLSVLAVSLAAGAECDASQRTAWKGASRVRPYRLDILDVREGVAAFSSGSRAGCQNIKTQPIIKHRAITYKVAAVDEERGIVLLRMNFGDTGSYGPGDALYLWEAFKVYGGEIHAVEAFMRVMPANAGWGSE
jgi:hypothetical protein